MSGYNTNLASEFHVLSCLHRLGMNATLTLGNKKGVDIVVAREKGDAVTVEVKGLAGKTGWPVDNVQTATPTHFLAFVCFVGRIDDLSFTPEVYVVPSSALGALRYDAPGGRRLLRYHHAKKDASKYLNAWHLIDEP